MFGIFKKLWSKQTHEPLQAALKEGAFLVDVRSYDEFVAGSVSGATNIPLHQLEKQLAKFKNKRNIIVFCRSGSRSKQAKSILQSKGLLNVYNGGSYQQVAAMMASTQIQPITYEKIT